MTNCLVVDACHNTPNYNYCLLDALAKRDVNLAYATTEFIYTSVPAPNDVRVLPIFFGLARIVHRFHKSRAVRRFLRGIEYPFDIMILIAYVVLFRVKTVHWMWLVFPKIDWLAIKLLRAVGCRVVFTAHNALPHELGALDAKNYARVYREVDRIIVLTHFVRDAVVRVEPSAESKLEVIPHGDYDPLFDRFSHNEELLANVRAQAAGRHIVGFLGSIRPYKGLEVFVESMPLIKELVADSMFLVAGNPMNEEPHRVERVLANICQPNDLWADIRYVPIEDLKAYVSAIDVLVQPYVEASQSGNTVMAYAAGVPVVSSDVGGLSEMVVHGETGYVVPPGDPSALAEAVVECLRDQRRLAENARRMARDEFGWQRIAQQTANIYEPAN